MIGRSSPEDEEVEEDREGGFDGLTYLGFLHPHVGTRSPYSFCIASSEIWPKFLNRNGENKERLLLLLLFFFFISFTSFCFS